MAISAKLLSAPLADIISAIWDNIGKLDFLFWAKVRKKMEIYENLFQKIYNKMEAGMTSSSSHLPISITLGLKKQIKFADIMTI